MCLNSRVIDEETGEALKPADVFEMKGLRIETYVLDPNRRYIVSEKLFGTRRVKRTMRRKPVEEKVHA